MGHGLARAGLGVLALIAAVMGPATARAVSCSIVRIDAVTFGAYDPLFGGAVDSTGAVVFRCVGVLPSDTVVIDLDRGGAGSFERLLSGGAWSLAYNLFLDAARTVVWGDGTSGTSRYGPITPPEDSDVTATIYGRIPSAQNVGAASYSDDLTVTITY